MIEVRFLRGTKRRKLLSASDFWQDAAFWARFTGVTAKAILIPGYRLPVADCHLPQTMQIVPPDRMPGEQQLAGLAAYDQALDQLLANAERAVRIFDRSLGRKFASPQRCHLMQHLLRARRTNRIYIVLHETATVVRDCPRLINLLRQFSHSLSIHQTLPAARHVYDPFAIGDDSRFVRRFHYHDMRGVATIGDIANTRLLLRRFEEIWEASVPAVTATTIGL
jgi:hypothetical protein